VLLYIHKIHYFYYTIQKLISEFFGTHDISFQIMSPRQLMFSKAKFSVYHANILGLSTTARPVEEYYAFGIG